MRKLSAKVKEEIFALVPPMIFFFIGLHIVVLVRELMLSGTGIVISTSVSVALTALIVAKAVIIANLLPFINRFPNRPLIYNVLWKTLIYAIIATVLHYLERLIDFWREAGSFIAGNQKLLVEMVWPHFIAIQIIIVVMIMIYCTGCELSRVMGRDKVREMFLGARGK